MMGFRGLLEAVGRWRTAYLARQLARPSGAFGWLYMANRLNRMNAAMNALAFEALGTLDGGPVLEVGFGGGALIERLTKAGQPVVGLELSRAMVARLGRRSRRAGPSISFGDICAMPFSAASFAKVCTVNTIYFWRDPLAAVGEIRRVLQPGGRVVICFSPAEELRRFPVHRYGFTLYDVATVEDLLTSHGFGHVRTLTRRDARQGLIACTIAARR